MYTIYLQTSKPSVFSNKIARIGRQTTVHLPQHELLTDYQTRNWTRLSMVFTTDHLFVPKSTAERVPTKRSSLQSNLHSTRSGTVQSSTNAPRQELQPKRVLCVYICTLYKMLHHNSQIIKYA
jgi:hypothetical protein